MTALLVLPAALPAAEPSAARARAPADAAVIVQAPGVAMEAATAVRRLGGQVTMALPIVSGFAATVPAGTLDRVQRLPGVRAVTLDSRIRTAGTTESLDGSGKPARSVFARAVGAEDLVAAGATGEGVRVALIDTGISTEVATRGDLAGRVVPVADPSVAPTAEDPEPPLVACVNLSGEDTCDDTFGHGTFLAGLIAGSGAASGGRFAGIAPGADIVSIKVAGRDGYTDVSRVLAGIQWAVSFAEPYDIRVLNLSMGTAGKGSPGVDPLNLAVQRAWVAGLTVVVSAGNFGKGPQVAADGSQYGTVTKPGDDPYVITVGAVDDRETPGTSDDAVPAFSSWGPTAHGEAKPDVVAPGGRLVSLRAKGSTIDGLPGLLDGTYRRGSGTSMAAAVTSGVAALLLDARDGSDGQPPWRPDDVKAALIEGTRKVSFTDRRAIGAGIINGPAALSASIDPNYRTTVLSDGTGTLDGHDLLWHSGWDTHDWTPATWYESQWALMLTGHNWQATDTWSEGHNWQGHNWQGAWWDGETDDQSYGTPIRGSGSYGAWG